jgi:hypothetical protein
MRLFYFTGDFMALGINDLTPIQAVSVDTNFEGVVVSPDPDGRLGRKVTGKQIEVFINRAGGDVDQNIDAKVNAESERAAGVEGALENLQTNTKANLVAAVNDVKYTADAALSGADAANDELPKKANLIITPLAKTLAQADVGDVIGAVTFDTSATVAPPAAAGSIAFDDGSRFDLALSGDMTYTDAEGGVTNIVTGGIWQVQVIDTGNAAIQGENNANSGTWTLGSWISGESIIDLVDVNQTADNAGTTANSAAAAALAASQLAGDALSNAAAAAQDAANAQHAADLAQDTADGKVDADFVANAVANAQLSVQTWLAAVQSKADLPDPSTLSQTTSYLCRVINDTDTPSNNGVWQLIAGAEEWTYFSDNIDFIDETELAAAIDEEASARDTAIGEEATARDGAISQAISDEVTARNGAIDTKVDTTSTGTITEDTIKFPASTVITFADFFKAVVAKINGIITALGTKQNTLVSGSNIKTINNNSLVGSGNIAVTASNFGGYRQDFFNVASGKQFTLPLSTSWSNDCKGGILEIIASAEYSDGYAKVFISKNSGTANGYVAQILQTYQSTTQSNDHLFEVVSAAGGLLTIKVLNPDTRYSQKIHVAWDSYDNWPLTAV